VDRRSGVSQRLPISALENVVSNAERRAVRLGDDEIVPRLTDIYAALPAITGKLELEYEGELVGGATIARELIRRAADATLRAHAPSADTDDVVMWFDAGSALQVAEDAGAAALRAAFETVPGLVEMVIEQGLAPPSDDALVTLACELVLEALVARRKISRNDLGQYGRAREEGRRRRGPDEPLG
jgi:magnesium chelatase subunit I